MTYLPLTMVTHMYRLYMWVICRIIAVTVVFVE